MKRILLAAAIVSSVPSAAQETPRLNLEQAMLLRCSAAFAIIASEQARGVASANSYPPLGERGREYFVRASARLMDELGVAREQIQALLQGEVERLGQEAAEVADPAAYADGIMQPCLLALEASGL